MGTSSPSQNSCDFKANSSGSHRGLGSGSTREIERTSHPGIARELCEFFLRHEIAAPRDFHFRRVAPFWTPTSTEFSSCVLREWGSRCCVLFLCFRRYRENGLHSVSL